MLTGVIPVPQLLEAYTTGFFPMADGGRIRWYLPDPRGILPLAEFHVPRRLARVLRRPVSRSASTPRFATSSRLSSRQARTARGSRRIYDTYWNCMARACALGGSVARRPARRRPVRGRLGGAFFGESMFHRATDASKVALVALVDRLRARGFPLLDIQWVTPHLETFGALEIPRRRYLMLLEEALRVPARSVTGPCYQAR